MTVGNLAIDEAGLRIALELGAVALAKARDRLLAQGKLPGRQQADGLHLVPGALTVRVEGADTLHIRVEEVDAEGLLAAHGKDVQQGAADGVFTVGDDLGDALVARPVQAQPGLVQV